jgi:molybdate transport system substrate-binding protein
LIGLGPVRTLGSALIAAALGTLPVASASVLAADIRVLAPGALRAPLIESARSFARSGGHRIEFVFASVAAVHKRVATGERADVAIGTADGTDALVRLGRGVEGSRVLLARTALALALGRRSGAPDIGTAAALAETLSRAETLVLPDAALGVPGGAQAAELLERLELAPELRARVRPLADVREVARRVASGAADMGIAAMSDLVTAADITVAGPIVEPRTRGIEYAAVAVSAGMQTELAHAFIAHLRTPAAQAVLRKAGFLPAD